MSKTSTVISNSNLAEVTPSEAVENILLARQSGLPVSIVSHPGYGKTDIFKQVAAQLNVAFASIYTPYLVPEAINFPLIDRKTDTVRFTVVRHFPTESHIKAGRMPEKGILVFEELPSAPPAIQALCNEPFLEHSINGEPLGNGWAVFATGNLSSSRALVSVTPSHTVSRLCHLKLNFSMDQWCDWAFRIGNLEAEVVAYARNTPNDVVEMERPDFFKQWVPGTPYGCPRSFAMLSRLLKAGGGRLTHSQCIMPVGEGVGTRFKSFLDTTAKLPNLDECILTPNDAPLPETPAMCYMVSAGLAKRATEKNFDKVIKYASRMEKMYEVFTIKDAVKVSPKLINTKAFITWAIENADVVNGG